VIFDVIFEINIHDGLGINQNAVDWETIACLAALINLIILACVNCRTESDAPKGYKKLPTY